MKLSAVYVALAVVLVADQCQGLHYKERADYNADKPKIKWLPYVKAELVVILPTMSKECDLASCPTIVKKIQNRDMVKRNFGDLAENFVVGGCTGIFTGTGWNGKSPMSRELDVPSVIIGIVGTFSKHGVPTAVAQTVQDLIKDGIRLGHIVPNYIIKFSERNGRVPDKFQCTMKQFFDRNVGMLTK